jgi:hypothetical protein
MEAQQLERRGLSASEARRRSALALGGIERVKDDVRDARGTRFLHDGQRDFGFALRTLARNPGFATVAMLTLAVGIGGTTAVFSAVDAVLLQPLPYQQPGQLVRLYYTDVRRKADRGVVTPVHFLDYRQSMSSFSSIAALFLYDEPGADIGTGDDVRRVRLLPVSADYFDVVRVQPSIGRPFGRDEETGAAVVVLSHTLWKERFGGNPSAVGQPLMMNGRSYTVAGVMPDGFADPLAGSVDAWVPGDLGGSESRQRRQSLFVRHRAAAPGRDDRARQAELDRLSTTLAERYPNARYAGATLDPLKEDIVGTRASRPDHARCRGAGARADLRQPGEPAARAGIGPRVSLRCVPRSVQNDGVSSGRHSSRA